MRQGLYWVGIRESEIKDTQGLFSGSITVFGSGTNGNYSFEQRYGLRYDYNQDNDAWDRFVADSASRVIEADPDCRFVFYDAAEAGLYGSEVSAHTACRNPDSLLGLLSDKFQTRQWLSEYVPILPYQMRLGKDLLYSGMRESFSGASRFVIQSSFSCGGSGTWLLTEGNQVEVLGRLDPSVRYAVTPYLKNSVSPNIHMLLYPDATILLPPSIQLIEPTERGFLYKGADYPMYRTLPEHVDRRLRDYARRIGDILRRAGYRGICGVDFLIADGEIYLMEVNARFQSSTFLLNRAMSEVGLPTSMQALHIEAFTGKTAPATLQIPAVPYSFYHYSYQAGRERQLRYLHTLLKDSTEADCIDDGLDWNARLEPETYLYKAVFRGAVSALGPESECRIDANVGFPSPCVSAQTLRADPERLKLMLLSHGTRLSAAAEARLAAHGRWNHEEFDALDIALNNRLLACVPYGTGRCGLSPFCVEATPKQEGCFLSYYGAYVASARIRPVDQLGQRETDSGLRFDEICYLGNDRLRVYHRLGCYFKDRGAACRFCDLPADQRALTAREIDQAVDAYRDHPNVRHYLIGGGSAAPESDFRDVMRIAVHIRDTTGKPVYLMSLPPLRTEILPKLKESGITQVAFNLELYDRELALRYMPGKGAIPLFVYDRAFRKAVEIWGKTGDVRTIFVVGLEPADSLLRGVDYAAGIGVAPILSLFRPAEGTPLQGLLPPSDREIMELYQQAKRICERHGIELGPACPYCQDNVLQASLLPEPLPQRQTT